MGKAMLLFALVTALVSGVSAAGPEVKKVDDAFVITTDVYAAKVGQDGALASLEINGVEFFAPPTEITWNGKKCMLPGVYASPMNQWYLPYKMPGGAVAHDNVVAAEGNGWKISYTFLDDAIDITYEGAPEGNRSFRAGYPPAELSLSLAHDLDRACDPENQGELG
ncbi:MAG: hypothetical protein ACYDBB_16390 [Armatimonadota bacterium]